MLTYKKLSTEKYWHESLKSEVAAYRRQKNRDAIRSLFQFIFACGMILFVLFATETMPIWLPPVTEFVTQTTAQVREFLIAQGFASIAQ